MKKYAFFVISFVILFLLFQLLSGVLLTITYTPNLGEAWYASSNLSKEVIIYSKSSFFITLLIAFLSATIAYLIQLKFTSKKTV